jgi:formyl-CoA transferase
MVLTMTPTSTALAGVRVLEMGQLIASPFAGTMLAAFGAEVVKLEPPGLGDPLRRWRMMAGDTSLWWYAMGRNKKSVTCDLRQDAGRDLARRLLATGFDVVLENFRPGRLEAWGLGPAELEAIDPRIILVRISGYGQTGPYRERPGFANVAEAFGGLRYITGEPGRPPVRAAASLGDTIAGLHAAYGALAALHERERSGRGQVVDVALYESVLNLMESMIPEYSRYGHVRERTGARLDGVVPSNTYPCRDGKWVAIGANADGLYRRLMRAAGRPDLADDPTLAHNDGRVTRTDEIDDAVRAWTLRHTVAEVLDVLVEAGVPAGPIQSVADLATDPHVRARGMFEPAVLPDGSTVDLPGIVPRLERTPGRTEHVGPQLGEHNDEIWGERLGVSPEERAALRAAGVI